MNGDPAENRARLYLWWSRLAAMTAKELIQFGRDTLLLVAIAYLFVFDTYMAGNVSMQLNHAVVVVHDADHSAASRELIYHFRPPHFRLGGEVQDHRAGQRLLDQGQALVVLDIPPHFERDILQGKPTDVQVQVDASNTVLGFLASSYAAQIIGQYGFDQALADVAQRNGIPLADLPKALASQGVDYGAYRESVRREMTTQVLRQRDVLQRINVSPREIEQFIAKDENRPSEANEYNLSHILIAVPQDPSTQQLEEAARRAEDVSRRARAGEDFAQLASAYRGVHGVSKDDLKRAMAPVRR